MRHERGGDATVTRGGRTGVCLADEVNGHTIRIHRPVPAIVESGVQHLDGCVVIGSIVHDDDAFRADRLGHPPAARAASRQWGGGALSPANADACVRARVWCGLWW